MGELRMNKEAKSNGTLHRGKEAQVFVGKNPLKCLPVMIDRMKVIYSYTILTMRFFYYCQDISIQLLFKIIGYCCDQMGGQK